MSSQLSISPIFCLEHGFELTFVPRRPRSRWQEWTDLKEAQEVTAAFNARLWDSLSLSALAVSKGCSPEKLIWGKADIFRSVPLSSDPQPHNSWCLEVNNAPINTSHLYEGSLWYQSLEMVYRTASNLGLSPCVTRRAKDGTLIEYPTGGGHQHVQLDFWSEGCDFLLRLYALEYSLCIDFCNNPWIRWLFSQWFDNLNSSVAINLSHLKKISYARQKAGPKERRGWDTSGLHRYVHDAALKCHSIKQRIAETGKPVRPTMEFRFFDMPKDMKELVLHSTFLQAWIGYHVREIDREGAFGTSWKDQRFNLTVPHYNRLTKDMGYARDTITAFMVKIGLSVEEVQKMLDTFFQDHYSRRMKHGKAI